MELTIITVLVGAGVGGIWAIGVILQKILAELKSINGNTLGLYRRSGGEG